MRTLFLTQDFPPDTGGIARLYGELCRRLPMGSVHVATVRAADPEAGRRADATLLDGQVTRLPFTFRQARHLGALVRWSRWTLRRIACDGVDLVQIGNIRPAGYVGAYVRRRTGVPYVIYVHGKDLWKERDKITRSRRARWTARAILGGASAIIANSGATAETAEALLHSLDIEPGDRVRVVHPGTDPAVFRPDAPGAAAWRAELGLDGRQALLTVSRLMSRKGVDTALEAVAQLAPRYPELVYLVAGTGPDRERLIDLAGRLGIADRVYFLGAVDDARLPGLYAAADLFVLPAREEPAKHEVEGFGIVFCEAAAAGVPVIAGRSGGVGDAVREGETALLVPPADPGATAHAIAALLDNDALRHRMGAAGRASTESYYHWDRAAAEIWAILEEVVAGEPSGRPVAARSGS